MGYIKAEEILPTELIDLIQQYVDGQSIYIPRKSGNRLEWGSGTDTKQELKVRNQKIYSEYLAGLSMQELAYKYYLSEKSIQRIIKNERQG